MDDLERQMQLEHAWIREVIAGSPHEVQTGRWMVRVEGPANRPVIRADAAVIVDDASLLALRGLMLFFDQKGDPPTALVTIVTRERGEWSGSIDYTYPK